MSKQTENKETVKCLIWKTIKCHMSTPLASSKPSYRKESKEGKAKRIGQGRGGDAGKCVEGTPSSLNTIQSWRHA